MNDKALESLTDDKMANVRKVFSALKKLDAWDADGIANFFDNSSGVGSLPNSKINCLLDLTILLIVSII